MKLDAFSDSNLSQTQVQVEPEVTSSEATKAWELETKNLHSNVVVTQTRMTAGNFQTAHAQVKTPVKHAADSFRAPSLNRVALTQGNAHANDSSKSPLRNASTRAQKSRHSDSVSTSVSMNVNPPHASEARLQTDEKSFQAPYLPPKLLESQERIVDDVSHLDDLSAVWRYSNGSFRFSTHAQSSREHSISISVSEISLPGVISMDPSNPDHYALLEKKMIEAGFYSVPKKPPVLPGVVREETADNSGCGALDDASDKCDARSDCQAVADALCSKDPRSISPTVSPGKNLFAPIEMKFDDHYVAPQYSNSTALSVYEVNSEEVLSQSKKMERLSSSCQFLAVSVDELDCLRKSGYDLGHCAVLCNSDSDEVIEI